MLECLTTIDFFTRKEKYEPKNLIGDILNLLSEVFTDTPKKILLMKFQ